MALTTNLINYWKLDEASGNASDSVGSLTLTNNNSVPYSTGKINNGAVFNNGTTQSLSSGGPAFGSAGTIAFWVFLPTGFDGGYFHDADTSNRYYHYVNSDGSTGCSFNGTAMPLFTAGGLPSNAWTHVVMTWDNSLGSNKQALYKNGTLYANTNNAISASTPASFYLGNRYSNTGTFDAFQGTLDEFGIWTRALSSTEVTQLYNGGAGLQYPFTANITVTPSAQTATFSTPDPVISGGATVSSTAEAGTFALQSPAMVGSTSIAVSAQAGSFSIQSPLVNTPDAEARPNAITGTFSMPNPVVVISEVGVTVVPSPVTAVFSLPSSVVTTVRHITVSPSAVTGTFSTPSRIITADKWQNKFTTAGGSWSNKY